MVITPRFCDTVRAASWKAFFHNIFHLRTNEPMNQFTEIDWKAGTLYRVDGRTYHKIPLPNKSK